MRNHLKIIPFLINKFIRGRKPLSLASDFIFAALVVLLLIPSTRIAFLSGVATVRTWFTSPEVKKGQASALDAEAWDWNFTDSQGKTTTFESLRGEVIFLNQWATWCPPCRAELNSIERLYRDYGSRVKFVILTGEDPARVNEFMKNKGYTFPVCFGSVSFPALATRSIPATAVVSRAGEIVVNRKGAFNWNSRKIRKMADRLLKEAGRI